MRRRRIGLLVVTLAALGATPAAAAEPDLAAPSVCAPPCADDQTCVGSTCVDGAQRAPALEPEQPPSAPQPPAGAAPTSGPQADQASGSPPGNTSPTGNTPPPGAAGPPQPVPLSPRAGDASPPAPGIQAPAPRRGQKRVFLALPYLGMHSYQHANAAAYEPGLRLGAFIGGRFNDAASLNLEVSYDYSNVVAPELVTFREWVLDFLVSPLFRARAGSLEVVFGPKAGLLVSESTGSLEQKWGVVFGVNAGFFVPASPTTSFGVLLSLAWKHPLGGCADVGGGFGSCGIAGPSVGFVQVFGLTAAAMF